MDKWALYNTLNFILILFMIVGFPLIFGQILSYPIGIGLLNSMLEMTVIILITFLIFLVMIAITFRSKKKEEEKRDIYSFVKIFKDDIALYLFTGRFELVNLVKIEDIQGVHFDCKEHLKKKGYGFRYRLLPLITLPPSPVKGGDLFYIPSTPMDHLVRVHFKKKVKILNLGPDPRAQFWGLPHYPKEFELEDLIIAIKPRDQKKFRSQILGKRK